MNNIVVQNIHKGQENFANNPLGHIVLWGWSYVVPISYLEKGITILLKPGTKAATKIIEVVATKYVGKNLIRVFKIGNKEIWINSGHGFETAHLKGSD